MSDPDQKVCLCFDVPLRKLISFVRVEKPAAASQLSDCFGAGTGCGWCRPWLERIYQQYEDKQSRLTDREPTQPELELPAAEEYARQRSAYRKKQQDLEP